MVKIMVSVHSRRLAPSILLVIIGCFDEEFREYSAHLWNTLLLWQLSDGQATNFPFRHLSENADRFNLLKAKVESGCA